MPLRPRQRIGPGQVLLFSHSTSGCDQYG
jgi:hypothetical protein